MTLVIVTSILGAAAIIIARIIGIYAETHPENRMLNNMVLMSLVAVLLSSQIALNLTAVLIAAFDHTIPTWEALGIFALCNGLGLAAYPVIRNRHRQPPTIPGSAARA